jgi:hypothetical protein
MQNPFPFFHLLSSDFSLDSLGALTSAQLASAWIVHPAYDETKHKRQIQRLWRGRREKGRKQIGVARLGCHASAKEREKDACFGFELMDLSWPMPADLDTLTSAQLAVRAFL